tara:strand:- start:1009 stop:1758 length:750 start_codon:yes stop_codon:yes gene_type:complete
MTVSAAVGDTADVPVRDGLSRIHRRTWQRLAEPGTWWDGVTRVAIAAEVRHAADCALCEMRRAALSPYAVTGTHDSLGMLPEPLVDVIHRIVTDPGRLSQSWLNGILAGGLSDAEYVETVGIIVNVLAVDQCRRGIGLDPLPLPEPRPGEPIRYRPRGAKPGPAWVPLLAPEDVDEEDADLYPDVPLVPYVLRALSLVPAETRAYQAIAHEQYTPAGASWDFDRKVREITFAQLELIASKVSVLNGCFY